MRDSKNREWINIISDPCLANKFAELDLQMDGHALSTKDKLRVYDAYIGTLCVMRDCATELDNYYRTRDAGYCRDFSIRNLTHILVAWSKIDVIEFVTQMKSMLLAIRHLSSKRGVRNYPSFDGWLSAYGVQRDSCVVQPMVRLLRSVWKTGNVGEFEAINAIVQYASRLTLTDVDWVAEEEIQKYFTDEESFRCNCYDFTLLDEIKAIINFWLRDFTFEGAVGQHGYGATAGVKRSMGTAAKYFDFLPTRETAILASWLDWWPSDNHWPGLTEKHEALLYADDALRQHPEWDHSNVEQHMRYNLVPKAFNKKRGVSMEPTSHMFMQKMIFGVLDDYFNSHPECHISLHDQERSRALCVQGSKYGTYSTIDLSSASDSVTNTLVKYLFQDLILGEALQLCRTSIADVTLTDGSVKSVELEKFAPMGSAVCFPIECLVFSAVVAVAQRHTGIYGKYYVYGDDIVLDSRLYDETCRLLLELNFKVNLDKSYGHESDFTEACGMEAYRGIPITPIRIGRKWDITKLVCPSTYRRGANPDTSTTLNAAYDAINDAGSKGYSNLRYLRLKQTLEKYPRAMFSHRTDMGIFSTHRGPVATLYDGQRLKYRHAIQQVYVKCTAVVAKTAFGEDYLRWSKLAEEYASTTREALSTPEDRIEVRCGAAHTYVRDVWFPLCDLE